MAQHNKKNSWRYFVGIFSFSVILCACQRVAPNTAQTDSAALAEKITAAEWQKKDLEKKARFNACVPDVDAQSKVHIALKSIRREPEKTVAVIVAYTTTEAADFYVPQYITSRGRWLMNQTARAYIRDENCREYKLQERIPTVGDVPDSGLIKLQRGMAYELTLGFPPLADEIQTGFVVYGKQVLPFTLLP